MNQKIDALTKRELERLKSGTETKRQAEESEIGEEIEKDKVRMYFLRFVQFRRVDTHYQHTCCV